jgi:hypothetical protein
MPTQFMLYKWLCDECAELYDTEPECHVHAREVHKHQRVVDDLETLEQISTRLDVMTNSRRRLADYQRVCTQILSKIGESMSDENIETDETYSRHDSKSQQSAMITLQQGYPLPDTVMTKWATPDSIQSIYTDDNAATDEHVDHAERIASMPAIKRRRRSPPTEATVNVTTPSSKLSQRCAYRLPENTARPYKCETCDRAFTNRTILNAHRDLHAAEPAYKCAHCPIALRQRVALYMHLRKMHPSERATTAVRTTADKFDES